MAQILVDRLCDVAVVGAGPAGASAAYALAEKGARVLLLEKATLPRYKTCGGGLTPRARRLLATDVGSVVERECRTVEIGGPEIAISVRRGQPLISMTMRDRLDEALVHVAQQAGAEVITGCEVLSVEDRKSHVALSTALGSLRARFVVAADGVLSRVARAGGWADLGHLAPAVESEIWVGEPVFQRLSSGARFDFDMTNDGYGWVFPKRTHLSVGVLSRKRGRVRLPELLERYYRFLGIGRIERQERHGSLIPFGPRRDGFVKGRVVLTGDAAGFVDPLTLEGISTAVLSGRLAGEILVDTEFSPLEVRRRYTREVCRRIVSEHRRANTVARLVYDYPRLRLRLMRRWGARLAETLAEVFCDDRSYHEILTARGAVRLLLSA